MTRRDPRSLVEARNEWRSLIEALPQLVWVTKPDGAVDYFSSQWTEYTGVPESELLGWRWLAVLHPDDREITRRVWTDSVAGRGPYDVEYRVRRRDGVYGWFKTRGVPIRDREGNIVKWCGSCTDITDRKRAEEALRQSEQKLRQARDELETKVAQRTAELRRSEAYLAEAQRLSRTGSWALNVATREITHWSQELYRLYGFDPGGGIPSNETFLQRIHPEDRARFIEERERAIRERADIEMIFRALAADGTITYVHAVGHPVFDASGDLVELVGTAMDVTERKRAEEERQAHLWFLECMDRVSRAIQGTNDLERMMSNVLDTVLSIFDCDRAWLVYPCDPQAGSWRAAMEHTRPDFPGAFALGADLPMDAEVANVFRAARDSSDAVRFGPGSDDPVPAQLAERFSIQSLIGMAVYPKVDKPYMFGLHQCSYPRVWMAQEERLFKVIGRRLADALTGLLMFRDLRESEARLEEAQRIAHVGYWDRDFDTGRVTWSDEAYRIFGLAPQERAITYAALPELIHPEDRAIVMRAVAEALHGGPRYDVEYRALRPDGEVRIVHSQGVVTRDESGRPRRMFGTVQDITERRRAEEELRESEAKLEEAQRVAHLGYWQRDLDADGFILSDEAYRIFGLAPQVRTITLAELRELMHPEDRAIVVRAVEEALRGGPRYEVEYRVVRPSGEVRIVHSQGDVTRDESGRPRRMFGTVQDITERRRAEEELRASDRRYREVQMELAHVNRVTTMGQLTASIAHEVNQPIAAAVTNAHAALRWLGTRPPDLGEVRQALGRIVKDGNRAGEVIGRIRALIKKVPRRDDPVDINGTILDVIALTRSELLRNGVSLQTRLAEGLPLIQGDRIQLQQVILNFIVNAIEAMSGVSEGSRELLVSTAEDGSDGVLVAVRDSGPGLPPQSLERLFDAFYTTKPGGMGMGLSICRSIIEAHGGRVWAGANAPKGAVFQFTLPPRQETAS